jgi:hypothetical protein
MQEQRIPNACGKSEIWSYALLDSCSPEEYIAFFEALCARGPTPEHREMLEHIRKREFVQFYNPFI